MTLSRHDRPIFFVGMPRSGTTILYEAFAKHKQLGWLSNYSGKQPGLPFLNILRVIFDNRILNLAGNKKQHGKVRLANRYLPRPEEAYQFWEKYSDKPFARHYMLDVAASKDGKRQLRRAVDKVMRWQAKNRFSTKMTGPARIAYLTSVFEDPVFIHVIRDGRAVVNSLLKVDFWRKGGGLVRPWWEDGLPEIYIDIWHDHGRNPAVLAAIQWRNIIELAQKEAGYLGDNRYLEVRYEEFMESPHRVLRELYAACGLEDSQRAHDYIEEGPTLSNMNKKYQVEMNPQNVRMMTDAMQPLLGTLGYA